MLLAEHQNIAFVWKAVVVFPSVTLFYLEISQLLFGEQTVSRDAHIHVDCESQGLIVVDLVFSPATVNDFDWEIHLNTEVSLGLIRPYSD